MVMEIFLLVFCRLHNVSSRGVRNVSRSLLARGRIILRSTETFSEPAKICHNLCAELRLTPSLSGKSESVSQEESEAFGLTETEECAFESRLSSGVDI